jgi:hypothetical protein
MLQGLFDDEVVPGMHPSVLLLDVLETILPYLVQVFPPHSNK